MHTNTTEPTCFLSQSANEWWERISPEKQRAHIKRHPNGKYAKNVKNGSLALKALTNAKPRIRLRGGVNKADPANGQTPDVDDSEQDEDEEPEEEPEGQEDEPEDEPEDEDPAPKPKPKPKPIPAREELADSYRKALPSRLKDGVKAFFAALDGKEPLGTRADLSDASDELNNGDIPALVRKMKPKNKQAASKLSSAIKATMPLAKIAAYGVLGLGAAVAGAGALPAILAVFFINSTLDIESLSRSDAYKSVSGADECDRLVNTFMDWVEGLDNTAIANAASEFTSTSSTGLEIKIRRCPLDFYRGLDEAVGRRYILVVGRSIRGYLMWDKKYGAVDKDGNGWYCVLVDGFNESSYRSERDPATLEPYTTTHKNDVVLVNPTRMPFEYAKQWATSVLRR